MRSPEEVKLDFLVGEWRSSDRTFPGPFGPGGTGSGKASYRWELGDKWLTYDFRTEIPGLGPYEVRGGVAYDASAGNYVAYSVNSMGKLLLYEGAWEPEEVLAFTLVHPQRKEGTRVSYTRLGDGKVRMTSERTSEAGGSEVYFETILSPQDEAPWCRTSGWS